MVSKLIILPHHGPLLPNLQWDSQDSYPDKHAPTGEIYSIQFNSILRNGCLGGADFLTVLRSGLDLTPVISAPPRQPLRR